MCQWWANRNPWAGYRMGPSPTPHVPHNPPNRGVNKPPFEIAAKSATIDWEHHVQSLSGLIIIVVMTLFCSWQCSKVSIIPITNFLWQRCIFTFTRGRHTFVFFRLWSAFDTLKTLFSRWFHKFVSLRCYSHNIMPAYVNSVCFFEHKDFV